MNSKVLMCIPSLTLRTYIQSHPITLSRMQEATIVAEFGSTEEKLLLLKEFADLSDDNVGLLECLEHLGSLLPADGNLFRFGE